jgi:2-hydroxychromene-2-carboxylate isomerase
VATLRFYFDYISTNAYLAWLQMPTLARRYGLLVEPVPVLFAGLLEAHGTSGPAETPAKALWMFKNNLRKAALLGAPLKAPAFHPFNPLLALRATIAARDFDECDALVTRLMEAVWVREEHVSEPEVVERAARDVGLDGTALVAAANTPEIKAELRRQTDDAVARSSGATTICPTSSSSWPATIRSRRRAGERRTWRRPGLRRCGASIASASSAARSPLGSRRC